MVVGGSHPATPTLLMQFECRPSECTYVQLLQALQVQLHSNVYRLLSRNNVLGSTCIHAQTPRSLVRTQSTRVCTLYTRLVYAQVPACGRMPVPW